MNKLLALTKIVGIGFIIASVAVALLVPEPQVDLILGLLGIGLILDGRLADWIRTEDPS